MGVMGLPIGVVESDGIHHIPVALQHKQLFPRVGVPHLACSVIATCDEAGRGGEEGRGGGEGGEGEGRGREEKGEGQGVVEQRSACCCTMIQTC